MHKIKAFIALVCKTTDAKSVGQIFLMFILFGLFVCGFVCLFYSIYSHNCIEYKMDLLISCQIYFLNFLLLLHLFFVVVVEICFFYFMKVFFFSFTCTENDGHTKKKIWFALYSAFDLPQYFLCVSKIADFNVVAICL